MGLARAATRGALVDILKADQRLHGVGVYRSFPGPDIRRESIYIARTEGDATLPLMAAAAAEVRDTFSLYVACQSLKSGLTPDQAEDRVELFMAAVVEAVGRAMLPGGLAVVVDALVDVELGEVNGPDSIPLGEGGGFQALGEVEVVCTAEVFTAEP